VGLWYCQLVKHHLVAKILIMYSSILFSLKKRQNNIKRTPLGGKKKTKNSAGVATNYLPLTIMFL